jgi:hypothetical protein
MERVPVFFMDTFLSFQKTGRQSDDSWLLIYYASVGER